MSIPSMAPGTTPSSQDHGPGEVFRVLSLGYFVTQQEWQEQKQWLLGGGQGLGVGRSGPGHGCCVGGWKVTPNGAERMIA